MPADIRAGQPPTRAAAWIAVLVVVVAAMFALRVHLDKAHMSLALLLLVLAGSAAGGRVLGISLALLSFIALHVFLLPPYYSISLANPLDWFFLAAFLAASIIASQLLNSAREKAVLAQERMDAERLKDSLLAAVSHDLRTPLTTIRALAHDLHVYGDERSDIVEQEAVRLDRIVTDLLDLSRLNAGALTVHMELNAVDDLLGALVERMEPVLNGRQLVVKITPLEPLLVGRFDLVHSLHVLTNLVDNAAKFSPQGEPIEVHARRDNSDLVIEVADRGAGIAPSDLSRIFEPFQRSGSQTQASRGSGLGLSIAKRLAEAQEGHLEYMPRANGGSVFALRLRAADLSNALDSSRPA